MLAIEVCHSCEIAFAAVAVVVAPVFDDVAWWLVIDGLECPASLSVEDCEEFGTIEDSATHTCFLLAALAFDVLHDDAICHPVGVGIADYVALSVCGAVGCLADEFGSSVAVEVIDEELRVVCSGADVAAHVDAPEPFTCEFVAVEEHVAGVAFV